jgi:type II secretory pathway component GspD/PulD (secretin)
VCLISTVAAAQPAPGRLSIQPLSQLDDRGLAPDLDNRTFALTFAEPVPIRDLLLMIVRGTSLSVVPDPGIGGTFIGELKNVTVRQALSLILPPLGLDYAVDGGVVKVFRREPHTRIFALNYPATSRTGSVVTGGIAAGGSSASISSATVTDVFGDVAKGVQGLLSERGTFSVDRKAGLVQVTDFPERLDRVAFYLDSVHDRVHRQVQIDVRVLEVELADFGAQSLDWTALERGGAGPVAASPPNVRGLRVLDVARFEAALAAQGRLSLLAGPRVLALNNEPVLVRATSQSAARVGERPRDASLALQVTPQIGSDRTVTLSLSPIVTVQDADEDGRPPAMTMIRETDTVARIVAGETLVLGGFTREQEVRESSRRGLFGRAPIALTRHIELVILLTATVVGPVSED